MSITLSPNERERLRRAAARLLEYPFSFWHYGDSIGFEGLLAAGDLLGDPRYQGWVHGAPRAWAARREPFRELDNTAPGHAMCLVVGRTGDEVVLEGARSLAAFLTGRRRVDGAFVSFERVPLREPYGGAGSRPARLCSCATPVRASLWTACTSTRRSSRTSAR